ncbi:hypothetical protein [Maribacter sp. 2304DJ31-5]|uniref:hypothetical protein n=1 Tax=Maribacter sp. 2304DJ31-5 TaxID=3386273 RepID=UPI0039BD3EB2
MATFLSLLQETDIEKKMQEAPNGAYEIGVFIGTYLPFVILVVIAYLFYRYSKKKYGSG